LDADFFELELPVLEDSLIMSDFLGGIG